MFNFILLMYDSNWLLTTELRYQNVTFFISDSQENINDQAGQ